MSEQLLVRLTEQNGSRQMYSRNECTTAGEADRTDLGKCTHQCDKTQGNNRTQVLLTKIVFFGCKIDNKEEGSKEEDRQEGADVKKES